MASLKDRLTEILINNKIITTEQLNEALQVQKEKGGRLSDILVSLKFIKENELISILSEGLGFPLIDLRRIKIDHDTAKIIPVNIARHYQIIPISKIGDTITLAMADPLNIFAIDHVGTLTGYKINPIISTSEEIMQTIQTSFPDETSGAIDGLVKEMTSLSIQLIKDEEETSSCSQEIDFTSRSSPVIKVTNMILEDAVKKKSSDVLIEPQEKKVRLRFRIDGVLQEQQAPPKIMHPSIVSRIKVMSNLDIAEHRLPQEGRFKAKISDREVDFRISVIPASTGENVALRILDKSQAVLDIEKLGFSQDAVEKIKKSSKNPHGMLLVCGPTGSGKTTTLYSVLKFVDKPEKNIVTVEDPVEYQLEGINQVSVRTEVGLTFARALRSILRQDPNIIMIGEIRDFETVDIAIKSALTGHLVLSTLHTTTSSGAISRLINMGVEPFLLSSSLICVVAQRLLRRLCDYCKGEYLLDKEVVNNLKIKTEKKTEVKIFRSVGCNRCFRTGYSGRLGIVEVLTLSTAIRELILKNAQEHIIKQQSRKEGMRTLREEGISLALKGMTTLEEVLRVTASDE